VKNKNFLHNMSGRPEPRISVVERIRRAHAARKALRSQNTQPLHSRIRAGAALFGTNYRVNQGINKVKNILEIPNNKTASLNNLRATLKRALALNDPLTASSEIKNKSLKVASNYVASRIGYRNNANVTRLHQLIVRILRLKQNMNAATNNTARKRIGDEIGTELGKLILAQARIRAQTANGSGRGKNFTMGFLRGILSEILGPSMAGTVMLIIQKTTSIHSWVKSIGKRPNNWVGNWPPRIIEVN
jgi:hypothetical protein